MSYSICNMKRRNLTTTYGQAMRSKISQHCPGTASPEDALWISAPTLEWQGWRPDPPRSRCLSVEDVIHTVRWTRAHGLPLSVRGAGRIFGRSLRENGVVIDLQMRSVTIDPVARTAQVQAGATAGDLIEAAEKIRVGDHYRTVSSVGMTGLTLGRLWFADRGLWAGCR